MDKSFFMSAVCGVLGLFFGSFATVLTKRVPENISIITPNSRCENCKAPIPRHHLIPLFSFLILRGQTYCCHTKISRQYPFIELATAILFMIAYASAGTYLQLLPALVLAVLTMPLSLIDIAQHRLPNALTFTGILAGMITSLVSSLSTGSVAPFIYSLVFAFFSGLCFLTLNLLSRGGMGMGDVKLATMLGALIAPFGGSTLLAGFIFAFFLGAVIGVLLLVFKKATRKTLIPFGPYLVLGSWIALAVGNDTCRYIINLWSLKR